MASAATRPVPQTSVSSPAVTSPRSGSAITVAVAGPRHGINHLNSPRGQASGLAGQVARSSAAAGGDASAAFPARPGAVAHSQSYSHPGGTVYDSAGIVTTATAFAGAAALSASGISSKLGLSSSTAGGSGLSAGGAIGSVHTSTAPPSVAALAYPPPVYALVESQLHRFSTSGLFSAPSVGGVDPASSLGMGSGSGGAGGGSGSSLLVGGGRGGGSGFSSGAGGSGSRGSSYGSGAVASLGGVYSNDHPASGGGFGPMNGGPQAPSAGGSLLPPPDPSTGLRSSSSSSSSSSISSSKMTTLASQPQLYLRSPAHTSAHSAFLRSLRLRTILLLSPERVPPLLAAFAEYEKINLVHFNLEKCDRYEWASLRGEGVGGRGGGSGRALEPCETSALSGLSSSEGGEMRPHKDAEHGIPYRPPSTYAGPAPTRVPPSAIPPASTPMSLFSPGNTHLNSTVLSERTIKESLEILLRAPNYPLAICDTSGIHEIGALVGCLRKIQRWSFTAILIEYRTFANLRSRNATERFVEMFDVDLVGLPELEGGKRACTDTGKGSGAGEAREGYEERQRYANVPHWYARQLQMDQEEMDLMWA